MPAHPVGNRWRHKPVATASEAEVSMSGERRDTCVRQQSEPQMPDFYMPAMWPLDLQRSLHDWFCVWQQRRLYRQLLKLDDRELAARDLDRRRLGEMAQAPLRQLVAQRRKRRIPARPTR
jgi:hypothetical protein